MAKYYITCSEAVMASSINDNEALPGLKKEPWLHFRAVSIAKPGEKLQVKWYGVVYIWDTREVVQVIEQQGLRKQRWEHLTKAIDNAKALKDSSKLMPGWMRNLLCRRNLDYISGPYDFATENIDSI